MKRQAKWVAICGIAAMVCAAHASPMALEGRDINGNAVAPDDASAVFEFDPNLNITWLRDWSYWRTDNSIDPLTWSGAQQYANNLLVGQFGGWTIPSTSTPDPTCQNALQASGAGCLGSQIGYLWLAELGNGQPNVPAAMGPFQNTGVESSGCMFFEPNCLPRPLVYWSSDTVVVTPGGVFAWTFELRNGTQFLVENSTARFGVELVRPGDVCTSNCGATVPEPQTLALVFLALSAAVVARRRRPH